MKPPLAHDPLPVGGLCDFEVDLVALVGPMVREACPDDGSAVRALRDPGDVEQNAGWSDATTRGEVIRPVLKRLGDMGFYQCTQLG